MCTVSKIRDLEKQLSDASNSREPSKLLAAIKAAQEANYTSDAVKAATKLHETLAAAINDCKSTLRRAVANKKLTEIATAIAKAQGINLPKNDLDFVEATNWEGQLSQLEKALESAVKANDMEDLMEAVAHAKEYGYVSLSVKAATDALSKLNFQKETRDMCKAAITAKDAKLLDDALVSGCFCCGVCQVLCGCCLRVCMLFVGSVLAALLMSSVCLTFCRRKQTRAFPSAKTLFCRKPRN
jgi:hypothetical protein